MAINGFAATGLILDYELTTDIRTDTLGLIKGNLTFVDESRLFFTEYLDTENEIEKLAYSFHYQTRDHTLIFRYDNAAHKPALEFAHHKHTQSGIEPAKVPDLAGVVEEIFGLLEKSV
ncbi:toxin-antitoxin system TumE family protein [Candidatus Venteria ishoeyi]|uniref:toxin-antitoxin system TumE family protein n=1 Tax=Candidatus Venteria ishoeyi TaxID=1899563 RepID=UPI0025A54AB5|nr:DUF6516 family protein [Candidatus Venteria ishoeyi]